MTENWTVNRLSEETELDRRTIKKILDAQNVAPCDIDGKSELYKLADFLSAFKAYYAPQESDSTLEAEQTRLTKAKADIAEVERARIRNEVIETETVFRVWENVAVSIRRTILTSGLPQDRVDAILNELRSLKLEDFLEQREFDEGVAAEIS